MKRIMILGNGGHSLGVQEALLSSGYTPEQLGIVDLEEQESVFGIQYLGRDEDLFDLSEAGWKLAAVGVGSVTNTRIRHLLVKKLKDAGVGLISVVSTEASVSGAVKIGEGAYIARNAVVQPGCSLRKMSILNTGAVMEHNCALGAFSHVSSGAILLGDVKVGDDTLIGAGSVVRQGIRIGNRCVIGMGSVVVRDIPDGSVAFGNPCQIKGVTDDSDYC